MKIILPLLSCLLLFISCKQQEINEFQVFKTYCEMVANDAKPIAFYHFPENRDIDELWDSFKAIAKDFEVELFMEEKLPETVLFPAKKNEEKTIVIIYGDDRLQQYLQWKKDVHSYEGGDFKTKEALARRLGRLLGYSPQGINTLLRENQSYRDLHSFGVIQQITHLYYENLPAAIDFYQNTLGLYLLQQNRFQIGTDGFIELHEFDGNHTPEQPKSTAIALLTDQLQQWYNHAQANAVPIKYSYKPKHGGAHDGFVAIDPGGYLLEFEEFKQHPENELFMAVLSKSPKVQTNIDNLHFFGTITWTYHKDLLKMQKFYEEELGYRLVADQGWTKIYQTTGSSFVGLVDERRGMEDYTDEKAIEIEWKIQDFNGYKRYLELHSYFNLQVVGPENYIYQITSNEN